MEHFPWWVERHSRSRQSDSPGRTHASRNCNKQEWGAAMSLLEANNVSKAFGGIRALDSCSITVEQGTITGLIGPNGSGKTTLFNVITGYERVDSGEIRFDGKVISKESPAT